MNFQSELHSQMKHPERYESAKDAFYDIDNPLNDRIPMMGSLADYIRYADQMDSETWNIATKNDNGDTQVFGSGIPGTRLVKPRVIAGQRICIYCDTPITSQDVFMSVCKKHFIERGGEPTAYGDIPDNNIIEIAPGVFFASRRQSIEDIERDIIKQFGASAIPTLEKLAGRRVAIEAFNKANQPLLTIKDLLWYKHSDAFIVGYLTAVAELVDTNDTSD